MSRGYSKLFETFFEKPSSITLGEERKKGRSSALDTLRNALIVDRYYFYGAYTEKRYAVILALLTEEFFLSESRITAILNQNYDKLSELKKQQPIKTMFKRKWPHLNWEV